MTIPSPPASETKGVICVSDDPRRQELAQFLRSRRERLSPKDVGLHQVDFGRRRTKGLRREELAALAGISLPWYTALEQGRDINVSDQVLDSLARALRLNPDERNHMYFLASPRRSPTKPKESADSVAAPLQFMLDQVGLMPAYISDEKMNLLAWNDLAAMVYGFRESMEGRERNMLWRMFMLPSYRSMFVAWDRLAGSILGEFRAMYTRNMSDPWYKEFVAELVAASAEFRDWWESYTVQCTSQYPRVMNHPAAGTLNFSTYLFPIQEGNGQYITMFVPDQKDGSVERLARLVGRVPLRAVE